MRVACMCVYKICVQTIVKTYNYFHTGVTSPPGLAFNPAFSSISVVSWSTRCCHDAQRRLKATQTSCGATPHSEQILGGELEVTGINCMNFTLGKGVLTHFGQLDSSHFLRCQIFITRPPKTFQTHWVSPVNPSLACTTKIPRFTTSSQATHLEQLLRRPQGWAPWRSAQQQAGTHVRQGLGEDLCAADIQWLR